MVISWFDGFAAADTNAVCAMVGLIACLIGLGFVQPRFRRLCRAARLIGAMYLTVLLILLTWEGFFRYLYANTDPPFLVTTASKNWGRFYLHLNSLGFRDREWTADDLAGKQIVYVTGDSLAEGWGIEDIQDRYGEVLAAQLGDDYAVLNVSVFGSGTQQQLDGLKNLEGKLPEPDLIIWQYLLNDIEFVAEQNAPRPPNPSGLSASGSLVRDSALANMLYWQWARPRTPGYVPYWDYLLSCYDNAYLWDLHRAEIEQFLDYVESLDARLITLIFPVMTQPVRSVAYVDRVAQVITERGHPDVLKLYDAVAAWDPRTLITSRGGDEHPSEAFHHYLGETLYALYFR